jgi:hypothetical protein
MSRDYNKRLTNLKTRRQGLDSPSEMFTESVFERLRKSEAYEHRDTRGAVRYALGAMQQVDPAYTKVGLEEADRVGRSLTESLAREAIYIDTDLQGSVPLNVHTRGGSDVDLLALHRAFFTFDRSGYVAQTQGYAPYAPSIPEGMRKLRTRSEVLLTANFPKATVDITGAKAIKMEGGSLKRKIDVVPSHWHNTAAYQRSLQKHDRGVNVWDERLQDTVANMPFLHIKRIGDRCSTCQGGLRKCIRLAKNLKQDAVLEGRQIDLPSYDIAALFWHADHANLNQPAWRELALLDAAQAFVASLVSNPSQAQLLRTPDETRRILDTAQKVAALGALAQELTQLCDDVADDLGAAANSLNPADRVRLRKALQESFIAS